MSVHAMASPPYPLHPSVVDKLDPEYVEFYNKFIINQQQVHYQPVAASRTSGTIESEVYDMLADVLLHSVTPPGCSKSDRIAHTIGVLIPGARDKVPVGSTNDYCIPRAVTSGPEVRVRVFTPTSPAPAAGYPTLLYFHGGGWVLGNIDTENAVCTRFCETANCVVVSVDYRLAPEDIWPAAVHDSWEALRWLKSDGARLLNLDLTKVAVGGSSAGGNLAAILTHKVLEEPEAVPSICFHVLVVPVTDNTASAETQASYRENENTAALPAVKMLWYRKHYLPDPKTWSHPEASPLLYPAENFSRLPPAFIGVAELDVLRSEGEAYAVKLEKAGVKVQLKTYAGGCHPIMAMDAVLTIGRKLVTDMTYALKQAFDNA